jgi:probable phosphoglycerate mutase
MVYLVRHGETDWNTEKRIQGQTDIKLNANGIRQARELAEQVKDLPIDKCICSPLSRAMETAKIIYDGKIAIDRRLAERSYGSYEGKSIPNLRSWDMKAECPSDIEGITAMVERSWDMKAECPSDIEGVTAMLDRTREFLDEMKAKYGDKNVLIVTHGGVIRAMRGNLDGIPESGNLFDLPLAKNCEILCYDLLEVNNEKSL